MKYTNHELADLFPMMDGAQWGNFLADVEANGVQEPVWLFEGKILDGRNRAKAAHLCEKSFTTKDFIGTREQALCFVVSRNLHRRHLDESQRAMVGARLKPLFEAEAHERQGQRTDLKKPIETPLLAGQEPKEDLLENLPKGLEPVHVHQKAAEVVNVSTKSVQFADTVLKQGTPELVKAVESGQVAVSAAATVAKNTTKEEQEELIQQGPVAIKEAAKDIRARAKAARQAIISPPPTITDEFPAEPALERPKITMRQFRREIMAMVKKDPSVRFLKMLCEVQKFIVAFEQVGGVPVLADEYTESGNVECIKALGESIKSLQKIQAQFIEAIGDPDTKQEAILIATGSFEDSDELNDDHLN